MAVCGARLRKGNGRTCRKFPVLGKTRCRLHGAGSLSGELHWNYQGKGCTKAERRQNKEASNRIKHLKLVMIQLGMIDV